MSTNQFHELQMSCWCKSKCSGILMQIILMYFSPLSAHAVVRIVPTPGFTTIQSALNASSSFDTVLVQAGTYQENIIWPSVNSIRLLSVAGSQFTEITGTGAGTVVTITGSAIDTSTYLTGFTISGGYLTDLTGSGLISGAGMFISDASVILDDVHIRNNHLYIPAGTAKGAGVHFNNSESVVRNSIIELNSIDSSHSSYGSGVYIKAGKMTFINTEIRSNGSNGSYMNFGVGMFVQHSTNAYARLTLNQVKIINNFSVDSAIFYYGSGAYISGGLVLMYNVLIASNTSGNGNYNSRGGGLYLDSWTELEMYHVTITDNKRTGGGPINGSGIFLVTSTAWVKNSILYNPNAGYEIDTGGDPYAGVAAYYTNIRGGYPGGNIFNLTPGFISVNDFHLQTSSPCANLGNSVGVPVYTDLDGTPRPLPALTNPDLGCYEVDQSATGIQEEWSESANTLKVYPSPANRNSLIYIENVLNKHIIITDMKGGLVFEEQSTIPIFNFYTGSLQPGMYLIHTGEKSPAKLIIH